jgi:hypothetical protein
MWDDIIGDLIMNGINEIKEIEKEEELEKKKEEEMLMKKGFKRRISEIVTFKNCKCSPMQYGINIINKAAEERIDQDHEKYNYIRLKNFDQKINNIKLNNVNKRRSKTKSMSVKK